MGRRGRISAKRGSQESVLRGRCSSAGHMRQASRRAAADYRRAHQRHGLGPAASRASRAGESLPRRPARQAPVGPKVQRHRRRGPTGRRRPGACGRAGGRGPPRQHQDPLPDRRPPTRRRPAPGRGARGMRGTKTTSPAPSPNRAGSPLADSPSPQQCEPRSPSTPTWVSQRSVPWWCATIRSAMRTTPGRPGSQRSVARPAALLTRTGQTKLPWQAGGPRPSPASPTPPSTLPSGMSSGGDGRTHCHGAPSVRLALVAAEQGVACASGRA